MHILHCEVCCKTCTATLFQGVLGIACIHVRLCQKAQSRPNPPQRVGGFGKGVTSRLWGEGLLKNLRLPIAKYIGQRGGLISYLKIGVSVSFTPRAIFQARISALQANAFIRECRGTDSSAAAWNCMTPPRITQHQEVVICLLASLAEVAAQIPHASKY